jgi:hypothetical protein
MAFTQWTSGYWLAMGWMVASYQLPTTMIFLSKSGACRP